MKQIIKVCIAIFMMSITTLGISAADTSAAAKKILDKAASKVSLKSGVTMQFTISGDKFSPQSGNIVVKGNKFNARTGGAMIWYDGKTQWTYMKKNEEVNISTPSASQQAQMNPYSFINIYKNGYTLSYEKTASGNLVHLVAQGKKNIKEMYILVDANSNIKQVRIKQNTNWTTISITDIKATKVSDDAFRFKATDCPNAEVIDLR